MTDVAIEEVLRPHKTVNIIWQPQTFLPYHPNGMKFVGKDLNGDVIDEWTVYSIGGGAISDGTAGNEELGAKDVYDLNKLADIKQWCYDNGRSFWEYVEKCESEDIWDYLDMVWQTMKQSIRNGLDHEGVLPGPLKLQRKAATYYIKAKGYRASLQSRGLVYAYALAVSEENASGGTIVTAPTCGACGVLPAVLYHMFTSHDMSEQRILRALATAGLVGNIVKQNASISGAECRLPGRGRCCLRHGFGCSLSAFRRQSGSSRICCRNGIGASSWNDLRPSLRTGSDSLHRAKCLCCPPELWMQTSTLPSQMAIIPYLSTVLLK